MCQHLTIEEMIRLHRDPPLGGVRPTEQDLWLKVSTVVQENNLIDQAKVLYGGQYRRQLSNLSTADAVDRLMSSVVMDPKYDPLPGRFITYARKNLFLYASELAREEKRDREAVLTHAGADASTAFTGIPQAAKTLGLQRVLLKYGNVTIPEKLIAATSSQATGRQQKKTSRDNVIFAAALIAGILPELQAYKGLDFVPLGKVGLRKLVDETAMPLGTTDEIWKVILHWKRCRTQRSRPRRRGFQTLLAESCGLSISTVSRSLASSSLRLAEPYEAAVENVVEAVRREHIGLMPADPT